MKHKIKGHKKAFTQPHFLQKRESGAGFTLIELLVVIAIIGLLASIVLVSVNKARIKARDARRLSDIRNLELALEMYYDDNGSYPSTSNQPTDSSSSLTPLVSAGYLSTIPKDPKPQVCGWWGNKWYVYGSGIWNTIPRQDACPPTTNNNTYALEFCLEGSNSEAGNLFPLDGCGRYCYNRCVR